MKPLHRHGVSVSGVSLLYSVCLCRDGRVRHNLAARYDARYGVFDWDYNMKLMDMVRNSEH